MTQPFEYIGFWWLPDSPQEKVSGILKFDPIKGCTLDLIGTLADIYEGERERYFELIVGVTKDSKLVSLLRCLEISYGSSTPGFSRATYSIQTILVGHLFNKLDDIVFSDLNLSYTYLNEWVGIAGFKTEEKHNEKGHFVSKTVSYEFPKEIEARIGDCNIKISFMLNDNADVNKVALSQKTLISIHPSQPASFDTTMSKFGYPLQTFLTLSIGEAVHLLFAEGKTQKVYFDLPDGSVFLKPIEFFRPLPESIEPNKRLQDYQMLFTLKDIADIFETCLQNWFSKEEALRPAYELYFGVMSSKSMYVQHQFLSLVRAIESYHRRTLPGKYVSDEQNQDISKCLLEAIPPWVEGNFRQSLKQRFKYQHEFSLRKRLSNILDKFTSMVDTFLDNKESFIEAVVNTRNYLTHLDKDSKTFAITEPIELYNMTQKLRAILEVCFMGELGIPSEKIIAIISRNDRFRSLRKN